MRGESSQRRRVLLLVFQILVFQTALALTVGRSALSAQPIGPESPLVHDSSLASDDPRSGGADAPTDSIEDQITEPSVSTRVAHDEDRLLIASSPDERHVNWNMSFSIDDGDQEPRLEARSTSSLELWPMRVQPTRIGADTGVAPPNGAVAAGSLPTEGTAEAMMPVGTTERQLASTATPDETTQPQVQAGLVLGLPPIELFPILGGGEFSPSFGAPRDGGRRQHKGNDIFAPKMTPVLAVASGIVVGAPSGVGEKCCYLKLEHEDGNQSVYLHLNNDTPGTDDGAGWGLADGIEKGVHVDVGDVIGYVGDSGNAEETPPHLHFEYRLSGRNAVDPYEMLVSAPVLEDQAELLVMVDATEPPIPELPFTGFGLQGMIVLAGGLLAAGTTLLLIVRPSTHPRRRGRSQLPRER